MHTYNIPPFKNITARITYQICIAIFWLNDSSSQSGISNIYSPRKRVTGHFIVYDKHYILNFSVSYAQFHEKHDNTNQSRTLQGGH